MRAVSYTLLASLIFLTPTAAATPTAMVATINATPYDGDFSIDGRIVDVSPGIHGKVMNTWPLLWRLTPNTLHTLAVVTTVGYAHGDPNDRSTYDKSVLSRCTVRVKPKGGDDYILSPSLPADKGKCPLRKFDHDYTGDLND